MTDDLKQNLLASFKSLKQDDSNDNDEIYLFAIESAKQEVLSYCHIDYIPVGLYMTVVLMANDALEQLKLKLDAEGDAGVTQIKEGDFSITKDSKVAVLAQLSQMKGFVTNYKSTLNRYRKLAR